MLQCWHPWSEDPSRQWRRVEGSPLMEKNETLPSTSQLDRGEEYSPGPSVGYPWGAPVDGDTEDDQVEPD